jgi:hypothetical protein
MKVKKELRGFRKKVWQLADKEIKTTAMGIILDSLLKTLEGRFLLPPSCQIL